ncbi:transposase [Candidatus Vecturithrix granuli]|uniref:Transposase n=1 Tax=Vecturithrix granuli TaxID=1499967 RepID=A0A081C2B1_VECG1|nr:transposase [Candidatus Vecturithrix granuli]
MGYLTGRSRAYGYAPCGERAVSYEPAGKGTRFTLVGALSVDGFLGGLEVTGSVNGEVFDAFVEQIVVPHLCPGKIVVLDNVPFHHRESIQDLIEAQGATVKFLPPYSPAFTPIEACRSKLNAWLRKCAVRTGSTRQDAITEAIQHVTSSEAKGWFRQAGYLFNGNE